MKNVTITLREDLADWLRVEAAKADLSMSAYLSELLESRMGRGKRCHRRKRRRAQALAQGPPRAAERQAWPTSPTRTQHSRGFLHNRVEVRPRLASFRQGNAPSLPICLRLVLHETRTAAAKFPGLAWQTLVYLAPEPIFRP